MIGYFLSMDKPRMDLPAIVLLDYYSYINNNMKKAMRKFLCTLLLVWSASTDARPFKFIKADAHEGPVCVLSQKRLYFTSKRIFTPNRAYTSIHYLDLKDDTIHLFVKYSNMVNSMYLSNDKNHLLLAEQGTMKRPGAIALINIHTKKHQVLIDNYNGIAFNSPNKVVQSKSGIIYFSDPDFGYIQKFKPKPQLPSMVYAYNPKTKNIKQLVIQSEKPHGLALSNEDKVLLVGTEKTKNWQAQPVIFLSGNLVKVHLKNPLTISYINPFIETKNTATDGFIVKQNKLYAAMGNKIQIYNLINGKLKKSIAVPHSVNLVFCQNKLYVTADKGIIVLPKYELYE